MGKIFIRIILAVSIISFCHIGIGKINEEGDTKLMLDAKACDYPAVKKDINDGADIYAIDAEGKTVLHYLAKGAFSIREYLLTVRYIDQKAEETEGGIAKLYSTKDDNGHRPAEYSMLTMVRERLDKHYVEGWAAWAKRLYNKYYRELYGTTGAVSSSYYLYRKHKRAETAEAKLPDMDDNGHGFDDNGDFPNNPYDSGLRDLAAATVTIGCGGIAINPWFGGLLLAGFAYDNIPAGAVQNMIDFLSPGEIVNESERPSIHEIKNYRNDYGENIVDWAIQNENILLLSAINRNTHLRGLLFRINENGETIAHQAFLYNSIRVLNWIASRSWGIELLRQRSHTDESIVDWIEASPIIRRRSAAQWLRKQSYYGDLKNMQGNNKDL